MYSSFVPPTQPPPSGARRGRAEPRTADSVRRRETGISREIARAAEYSGEVATPKWRPCRHPPADPLRLPLWLRFAACYLPIRHAPLSLGRSPRLDQNPAFERRFRTAENLIAAIYHCCARLPLPVERELHFLDSSLWQIRSPNGRGSLENSRSHRICLPRWAPRESGPSLNRLAESAGRQRSLENTEKRAA